MGIWVAQRDRHSLAINSLSGRLAQSAGSLTSLLEDVLRRPDIPKPLYVSRAWDPATPTGDTWPSDWQELETLLLAPWDGAWLVSATCNWTASGGSVGRFRITLNGDQIDPIVVTDNNYSGTEVVGASWLVPGRGKASRLRLEYMHHAGDTSIGWYFMAVPIVRRY